MQEFHGHVRAGGRVSARNYNKMADATARTALSRHAYGIRSSMGLVTRTQPLTEPSVDILRGYWPFVGADGDEDISGHGYDGTIQGGNTTYDVLELDGTNDYFDLDTHVASFRALNQGSISFWFLNTAANRTIMSLTHKSDALSAGSFYISHTVNKIKVYCYGLLMAQTDNTWAYGRWYHAVYCSDSTGNAIFVNGKSEASTYSVGAATTQCFLGDATPDANDPADCLRIGHIRYNSTDYGHVQGAVSDFRIYTRGLTHAEIIALYQAGNHRNIEADLVIGGRRIFEVQSNATGDGVYNCYEQVIDATEWDDTAGDPKFDDFNTTNVEVLNLEEADPESEYVRHLSQYDLIEASVRRDDEGVLRWAGTAFRIGAHGPRVAYVKTTPTTQTVTCYLDKDATGTEITVYCFSSQGNSTNLDACTPRLIDGDPIVVSKVHYNDGSERDRWVCHTVFQPTVDCDCYTA